jgi:hypothetical protein
MAPVLADAVIRPNPQIDVCVSATRTYRNVRYPVVMGWQVGLEEAILNDLD